MGMFEYVAVLSSIIIGLGMTHLLQGTVRLIQEPEEGRFYWLHFVWVSYMFLTAIFWWWWEFRLTRIQVWTFQVYAFVILFAVMVYVLCALLYPPRLDGYGGFKKYFYDRRAWFFGLLLLFLIVDVGDTWLKGRAYVASLGPEFAVSRGLKMALCVIAIRSRNERFHATFGVANLLYQVSFVLRHYETVA